MFLKDLQDRNPPAVVPEGIMTGEWPEWRRRVIGMFERDEYGIAPPPPPSVRAEILSSNPRDCAGKAEYREVRLSFDTPKGEFAFPVGLVLPNAVGDAATGGAKYPIFVYISFAPYPAGRYCPVEEIVDGGFGLAMFNYNDVAFDGDDGFAGGLAAMYDRRDPATDWGKLAMWAWAASRVTDYVLRLDGMDRERVYCVGHSRLGKAALWSAALDERFAGVGANCSGCAGVALARGTKGERVGDIVTRFPYWFCGNYQKYAGRESEMPFDQSMLAASFAPRRLAVCDAIEDTWCDPSSEYMSLYQAGKAYEALGLTGFGAPAEYPRLGARFARGELAYSLRPGTHFLSRADWGFYMDVFNPSFE